MNKKEILSRIGDITQIGGIKDVTFNDGRRKGVRAIEVNTGKLCFTVLPDRCMDIAYASYQGTPISWISKTGITAPTYYEKDGRNFLRGFFGGLVTTCGLKNIGGPFLDQGLHGRSANLPGENISIFADWVGDEYIMKLSGQMRECAVFGENLVIKRTITTKLFSNEFTLEDTIVNQGFSDEKIALCYHCNFGYPLVDEGASIIHVPAEVSRITGPIHGKEEECIPVVFHDDLVTVGIQNKTICAYLTYKTDHLPDFLIWKMLGESEYVVGLEPRTTCLGGEDIQNSEKYVVVKPFEEYQTYLKFQVCSR